MKFTKKMKLVECVDDESNSYNGSIRKPSNSKFIDPKTLFNLDSEMDSILSRPGCTDSEKWVLYNKALWRYLHFASKARPIAEKNMKNTHQEDFMDSFNSTFHTTTEKPGYKTRDSLESIKPSNVRDFFIKARENVVSDYEPTNRQTSSLNNSQLVDVSHNFEHTSATEPEQEQEQFVHTYQQQPTEHHHNEPPNITTYTPHLSPQRRLRSRLKRAITPPVRSTQKKKNNKQRHGPASSTTLYMPTNIEIPMRRWEELSDAEMCFSD